MRPHGSVANATSAIDSAATTAAAYVRSVVAAAHTHENKFDKLIAMNQRM